MTDCAPALVSRFGTSLRQGRSSTDLAQNGYGIGARYDGTYSKQSFQTAALTLHTTLARVRTRTSSTNGTML